MVEGMGNCERTFEEVTFKMSLVGSGEGHTR